MSRLWLLLCLVLAQPSAAQIFGPLPYTKSADTPAGFSDGPVNIENFEDGVIAPDLIIRGSIVSPSNVTDSVDYDDGVLDGLGRAGRTLQNSGAIRVDFAAPPTAAGLVWTDGPGQVTFEAFGLQGQSLGVSGPHALADGNATGGTAEDRFFGIRNSAGIRAIEVRATGGIEIDHVQWQIIDSLVGNTSSFSLPNASFLNGAAVSDFVRLSDGKYLIAGTFERLGGVDRPAIARLNADGSLDNSFSQSSFSPSNFLKVLVDALGRIYVIESPRVLRLNPNGSRDTSFAQVNFSQSAARTMALVSDGLIVGGGFTSVSGLAREGLVKLRFDGSVDTSFNLSAPGTLALIASAPDQVLVAGSFSNVSGIARAGIAKINTTGTGSVVLDWNASLGGASPSVQSLALDGNAVYASGSFLRSATASNLAKLSLASGAIDTAWNISANGAVPLIRVLAGSVYASAPDIPSVLFSNPPAAAVQRHVARINSTTGALDASFNPIFNGFTPVRLTEADGGRLLAAGAFTTANSLPRIGLAQLNANGSTDTLIVPASLTETATLTQVAFDETNNRIYAIGDFALVNNVAIANFARLSNGVLDTAWRPAVATSRFSGFVVRPGSGVWVHHLGGVSQLSEVDGSIVPGWTNTTGVVAMTSSAQALYISNSTGTQRLSFAGNGSADPACNGAGRSFNEMQFDATSNSIVGRSNAAGLQKIDASTCALIPGFSPASANTTLTGFVLDGKGGIWVAGNFTQIGTQTQSSPARLLLATGAVDTNVLPTSGFSFNSALGYDRGFLYGRRVSSGGDTVILRMPETGGATDVSWKVTSRQGFAETLAFGSDRLVVGGDFSGIASDSRSGIAAIPLHDRLLKSGFE